MNNKIKKSKLLNNKVNEKKKRTLNQIIKKKAEKNVRKNDNKKELKKLKNKKTINFNKISKKDINKAKVIGTLEKKKRMKWELIIAVLLLFALSVRLAFIQFVQGSELQSMAYMQQTLDRNINPKRGTIYDSTGKTILAVSSTVETVSVTPTTIKKEDREKI